MRNKKRKICGVGVNDYEGVIRSQGEIMYEYVVWSDMIRRCYSVKERSRLPTYAGYQAEPYFHYFTNFLNFIKTLKGFNQRDEKGKVFEMDKDLLIKGNKTYSRSSICFLPSSVNKFLTKSNKSRGTLYITKAFDDTECIVWLIKALKDHGVLSRKQIDELLWGKLPIDFNESQKKSKVGNILTKMRKHN